MRALYLYFAEPAEPDHDRSTYGGGSRPVDERPLVPIPARRVLALEGESRPGGG